MTRLPPVSPGQILTGSLFSEPMRVETVQWEEFRAGHIPGALSVPLPDLKKRLAELLKGREVVAYCRGPYCVMAIDAVALLRKKGFRAHRMEEGVVEWRARGGRVETSRERAQT